MSHWQGRFKKVFHTTKPIIGMVHLKPLPGAPRYDHEGGMQAITDTALQDARELIAGGIDAIQIENQWDRPFQKPQDIGPETVASMAAVASRLREEFQVPMGITVHLNGVKQALAIAVASRCQWIRAFELANAYIANAGLVEAAGPDLMRYRAALRAEQIMVFGDFHVKHGSHWITSDRSIPEQAEDVETALGDAVIVTGIKTGTPPDQEDVAVIRNAVSLPILIGSGLSSKNLDQLLPLVDGAIVGSSFKKDGVLANPVDRDRVRDFMDRVSAIRGSG
jgi:membrane complex biogenesis BtpA family protein